MVLERIRNCGGEIGGILVRRGMEHDSGKVRSENLRWGPLGGLDFVCSYWRECEGKFLFTATYL